MSNFKIYLPYFRKHLSSISANTRFSWAEQDRFVYKPKYFADYSTEAKLLTLSHVKGPTHIPVVLKTFGQLFEEKCEKYPDRILVNSVEQGKQLCYQEALRKADRLAAGLLSLGLQRGDRIALWAPNTWQWLVVSLALFRSGLILVALNPSLVGEDAVHCLTLSKVSAVIVTEQFKDNRYFDILLQYAPELRDAKPGSARCAKFPHLRAAICLDGKAAPWAVSIDDLAASASDADIAAIKKIQCELNPEDSALFQFSSGTTGMPKACEITHKNFVNNGISVGEAIPIDGDKPAVYCVQVPLFHAFGLMGVISLAAHIGCKIVLPSVAYSPKENLKAFIQKKCNIICGTPTMYVDLVRQTEIDGRPSHHADAALTGGAPLVPQMGRNILEVLNVKRVHSLYGMSETTAVTFQSTREDTFEQMCLTVGKATHNVEAKVVDDKGQTVPVNTCGELWVRGYLTMKGYFDQKEATDAILTYDGWIKTGDQFVIDEHGYGKIIGRYKDIIIRGGENISPKEIEDILTTHPSIIDAQVVGVKDDRLGEEVCSCLIVRKPITPEEIRQFCKDKIAKFKIPRYYAIMEGYPKTTSGKVQKHKLREICNRLLNDRKLTDTQMKSDI